MKNCSTLLLMTCAVSLALSVLYGASCSYAKPCLPTSECTIPLLKQNDHDYQKLSGKIAQLVGNKDDIMIFLSDYTYIVFDEFGYSLAETMDMCISNMANPQFNAAYIKSGLQKLVEPVFMALAYDKSKADVIKKGYISQATLDKMAKLSEAEKQPKPKGVSSPSYDCAKASTPAEKIICGNDYLKKLDLALDKNFKMMLSADIGNGAKEDLKKTQKEWVAERDRCTDANSIVSLYKTRIDDICDYPVVSGVHPPCTSAHDIK